MRRPFELITSYALLSVCAALDECGCFEALKKNENGITIKELSERLSLNESALACLIDFIVVNEPSLLLEKEPGRYGAGELLLNSKFQNNLYFFLAYMPVLSSLESLLRGDKVYGMDFKRRGEYLQRSSAIHNKEAYGVVAKSLKNMEFDLIADIGCGRGDFLVDVFRFFPDKRFIGIESDKSVVEASQRFLKERNANESISVIEGDASAPQEWRNVLKGTDPSRCVFVGITLWHEFLNKQGALSAILKRYRSYFPKSTFIAVEYNGFSVKDLAALPEDFRGAASFYQFVHPLTNQGVPPSVSAWQTFFMENGVLLTDIIPAPNNLTVYVGILAPLDLPV